MDSSVAAAAATSAPPLPSVSPSSSTPRSIPDPWISSTIAGGGTERLRLMCSYGGRIVPRPTDKALRYLGGETRIVAVDRFSPFSDLQSRLSQNLPLSYHNFTIKYQLPSEDLDSLISLASDEDLDNLIDEYDRVSASKPGARIRLFVFPEPPPPVGSLLADSSKADAWFVDALNGTTIPGKGSAGSASVNSMLGLDEQPSSERGQQEKVVNRQQDVQSVPDSPMLETASSSFGSTSSAFSMSSLPPIRVRVEEQSGGIEEQFAQMSVASSVVAPAVASQKTEDTTENGEKFFSSDDQLEHGDAAEKTSGASHISSITDPISRQSEVPVSVEAPIQMLPRTATAHMMTLMNEDQLREFAHHQQQQQQQQLAQQQQFAQQQQQEQFAQQQQQQEQFAQQQQLAQQQQQQQQEQFAQQQQLAQQQQQQQQLAQQEQQQQQFAHQQFAQQQHQQQQNQQYVHSNPSYVHPQTGSTSHLPGYYQMPYQIQQPQTQAQSYSLDQQLPYYLVPVQHPPPLPYNLIPQAAVADANKSNAVQGQGGGMPTVYGTTAASMPKSVPPVTPTVPLIHLAPDNAHPYTGATYHHMLHHNHSNSLPAMARYPFGFAPPAGSQGYYTQTVVPPHYQTVSGSATMPEASAHLQHPELNQAREL